MNRATLTVLAIAMLMVAGFVVALRYGDYRQAIGETRFRVSVHDSALAAWGRERDALIAQAETSHAAADALSALEHQRREDLARAQATSRRLRGQLDLALHGFPDTSAVRLAVDALRTEADVCGSALAICAARADSLGAAFLAMRAAVQVERVAHDSTRALWRQAEDRTAKLAGRGSWDMVALGLAAGGCLVGGYGVADGQEVVAVVGLAGCTLGILVGVF